MRYCLEFYWQQGLARPHCLLLSPLGTEREGGGLGASSPARKAQQECWERPRVAQVCPLRPSQRCCPREGVALEASPAAGGNSTHSRASPREAVGDSRDSCPGCWAQPLLLPGLLLAAVQPWHSPTLQGPGALPALQPLWLQQLSPAAAGSSHSSPAQTLRCVCVTPRAEPALQRGSKPYNTTARHPSQAWRGWGEQGVHVINIKSATKKRHILYIFDPYTQEHNIHRTPRRSGDVVRRFLRDVAPLPAPPLCLPHSWVGLYSQNISHQKFHQAGTRHCRCVWMECSWPPPCLPCCPGGEVGEEDGDEEGGQARGTLL